MSDKAKGIGILFVMGAFLALTATTAVVHLTGGQTLAGVLQLVFVIGMVAWAFYILGSIFGKAR